MSAIVKKSKLEKLKRYKPYPAYKDSRVEWLGEVPEHWDVFKLKHLILINPTTREISNLSPDTNVNFIPMEALGEFGGLNLDRIMQLNEVKNGYTYFRNGDVIVAKITPCFENNKGAIAINLHNGIAFGTTELHVLRANPKIMTYLLFYITTSYPFRMLGQSNMNGAAGQKRIPEDFIINFRIGLPSNLEEQSEITNFLDRETARIDALIAKQERLIELLQEKRAALISRAVTKGLDPNVPMKDSGVEWLGEIPARWKVMPLKRIADVSYGVGGEIDSTIKGGTNLISLPNISIDGQFVFEEQFYISEVDKVLLLKKGDLLFNWRNGSAEHLGKTAYFDLKGQYTHVSFLLRIRFKNSRYNSRYFYRLLNSLREESFFKSSKAGVNNTFNQTELRNLVVIVPPAVEQKKIADCLDYEITNISCLIDKISNSIALMKEYRTALISATVTGKIDLRGEVF